MNSNCICNYFSYIHCGDTLSLTFKFTILVLVNLVIGSVAERIFPGNPYSHRETFDTEGKYVLEWIGDTRNADVLFNITAETRGWVGFGISKSGGKMIMSDMVVAGVTDHGQPYIRDLYTNQKRLPIRDVQQNWRLVRAWENSTHTSVMLVRDRETCDPHDLPLNENTMHLLWAFGENDIVDYHLQNRGSVKTHLFQPDLTPEVNTAAPTPVSSSIQQALRSQFPKQQRTTKQTPTPSTSPLARFSSISPLNESKVDVWRLTVTVNNTNLGDSWCVFQQGPELRKMHYIIGFSIPMNSDKVFMNLDRVVVYKCSPNAVAAQTSGNSTEENKEKENFQHWTDYSGECKNATALFSYCRNIIYTWGNGGKDIFLPKDTGIPFGGPEEFYLVESFVVPPPKNKNDTKNTDRRRQVSNSQAQQINSTTEQDINLDIDIDLLLTETARRFEAKIFRVGYNPAAPLIIPPAALDFEVYGHCPNECTTKLIPRTKPLRIFGVSFDTGPLGKAVALHHLRNAFEIPIILQDHNHDPSFQQMQILRDPTPIRPGDQLTVRCKLNSATPSPSALNNTSPQAFSFPPPSPLHYSPRCLAYLWYYQEINNATASNYNNNTTKQPNLHECMSKIHPSDIARWIDENAPIELKRFPNMHVNLPQVLVHKLKKIKWTPHLQHSLRELYELGRYRSACGGVFGAQQGQKRNPNTYYNNNGTNGFRQNINRSRNNNNGTFGRPTHRTGPTPTLSPTAFSSVGEITVYPLPVEEELPYTIGCPSLDDQGLLFGAPPQPRPHAPVIFG